MDDRLATLLEARAGGPVDTQSLLDGAIRQGRRRIRRKRVAILSSTVATVLAIVLAVALLPRGSADTVVPLGRLGPPPTAKDVAPWVRGAPTGRSAPAVWTRLPKPAVATGEGGAVQHPEAVGADPGVFHFDVEYTGPVQGGAIWAIEEGAESVQFAPARAPGVSVMITREPHNLYSYFAAPPISEPTLV